MGFDLVGLSADSEVGEYFRNNVWWWRGLAGFVLENAGAEMTATERDPMQWSFNNGHKVSAKSAKAIAKRLKLLLKNGEVAKFSREWKKNQREKVDCSVCTGSGHVNAEDSTCKECKGSGKVASMIANYGFSVENVRHFAEFCEHSGGFYIG